MAERGIDLTVFSPRASAMGHHIGDEAVSTRWTQVCNDLIARVVALYPDNFVGVCQLPQSPGVADRRLGGRSCAAASRSWVSSAATSTPTPAAGTGPRRRSPTAAGTRSTRPWSSSTCRPWCTSPRSPTRTSTPPARTTSTPTPPPSCSCSQADLFTDFPDLRLVIPHGGGAVPYHWGRFRGLADMLGRPARDRIGDGQRLLRHLRLPPAGHRPALRRRSTVDNILFGSEMVGAVRGIDPQTGHYFDDTRRYVENLALSADQRQQVYETNARRTYPRLAEHLPPVGTKPISA